MLINHEEHKEHEEKQNPRIVLGDVSHRWRFFSYLFVPFVFSVVSFKSIQ